MIHFGMEHLLITVQGRYILVSESGSRYWHISQIFLVCQSIVHFANRNLVSYSSAQSELPWTSNNIFKQSHVIEVKNFVKMPDKVPIYTVAVAMCITQEKII